MEYFVNSRSLQLFAEDGGSESGVTEAVAQPQSEEPSGGPEDFEKLIKGPYKQAYDARVKSILQQRLKSSRETAEKYAAAQPVLELMRQRLGIEGEDYGAMEQALPQLDRRLHGFADPQAVLTGVETRSSSPVRIVRGKNMQAQLAAAPASGGAQVEAGLQAQARTQALSGSPAVNGQLADVVALEPETGLYPCGEGAGYAGGIMSAACDGLRVASALVESLRLK